MQQLILKCGFTSREQLITMLHEAAEALRDESCKAMKISMPDGQYCNWVTKDFTAKDVISAFLLPVPQLPAQTVFSPEELILLVAALKERQERIEGYPESYIRQIQALIERIKQMQEIEED